MSLEADIHRAIGELALVKVGVEALQLQCEALRSLVDSYGDHWPECDRKQPDCSCGLRQAIRATRGLAE